MQTTRAKVWKLFLLILLVMSWFAVFSPFGKVSRQWVHDDSEARARLEVIVAALQQYKFHVGCYPGQRSGAHLEDDTETFVRELCKYKDISAVRRLQPCVVKGKLLSPFGKPYHYSCPVEGVPAPDGANHAKSARIEYYLWTWSPLVTASATEWAVNNWTK